METVKSDLDWIETQFEEMVALAESWSNINTHASNVTGLKLFLDKLELAFRTLEPDEMQRYDFDTSPLLFLKKRASAPLQLFLGGHTDTVFAPDHPFQKVTYLNDRRLQGPGIFDMKGGIVILLKTMQAIERSPFAKDVGWTIVLNADEEEGSLHSTPFIQKCAKGCHCALFFEPTLPGDVFVSFRKGSINYRVESRGKAAHVGRNLAEGKNAIVPLARFICALSEYALPQEKGWFNIGTIKGGDAANIVPPHAQCELNFRAPDEGAIEEFEKKLHALTSVEKLHLSRLSLRPPKLFTPETEALFQILKSCGQILRRDIKWEGTGGACDGNTTAALGIPTIDTLGVSGGKAHTDSEFIELDSLTKQAKLAALLIEQLSAQWPKH